MGDEHVEAEEEDEHGGAVLQVAVQLAHDSAEAQEADHLQCAEQTSDALSNNGLSLMCLCTDEQQCERLSQTVIDVRRRKCGYDLLAVIKHV